MGVKGFTLVEIMMATAGLSALLLLGSSLTITTHRKLVDDGRSSVAVQVASSVMEDLLDRYPSDPLLTPGSHSSFFDVNGNPTTGSSIYTATWTITPNTPIANVLSIQETIQWVTAGFTRQISLSSCRSSI